MEKNFTRYFIVCLLILFANSGYAQLNYQTGGFSTFASTYVDLGTSGTAVVMTDQDTGHSTGALPIGFNFNFNGGTYTSFVMYVDGFIKIGNSYADTVSSANAMLFSTFVQPPAGGPFNSTNPLDTSLIIPFGQDLWPGTNTADFRYILTGTIGSRICTIQWKNLKDKLQQGISTQYDTINFQVKLFEGTNAIEFLFGRWAQSTNVSSARFGASGIKGNYTASVAELITLTKASSTAWAGVAPNLQTSGTPLGNYTTNALNYGNAVSGTRPAPDLGRVYHFNPVVFNDASVRTIYAWGKIAKPYFQPDSIRANIFNPGVNALSSLVVTLSITGANTYTTTATIPYLASGTAVNVGFAPYMPANNGQNLITVSVPNDDNNLNNSATYGMSVSNSFMSYTDTTKGVSQSYGTTIGTVWGNRFRVNGSGLVSQVRSFIAGNSLAQGDTVCGMVLDMSGNILGRSANYIVQLGDLGTYLTFNILTPPAITNSHFLAGIAQGLSSATHFLGTVQNEIPTRVIDTTSYQVSNGSGISNAAVGTNFGFPSIFSSATLNYRLMMECTVDPIPPIAGNTISGAQSICSGSIPTGFIGSTPTGGTGIYTYTWISSVVSATAGFSPASGTNNTQNYSSGALTTNSWFRRITYSLVTDTSAAILVTVSSSNNWLGTSSNAWGIPANWGCTRVPLSTDNVNIGSGAPNYPVIIDGGRAVNNLSILTGGSLTLNNAASYLSVYGTLTNSGTLSHTNGNIGFAGSALQSLPANTYARIEVANSAGISLTGNVAITDSLKLTNGGLSLNGFNLTMNGTGSQIVNSTFTRYISTNGTSGSLILQNVGSGGRTGAVLFPVGNSTYNPVTINNTGTSDQFSVRVIDSVTSSYSGSTPSGTKVTSNSVNRSWIISEQTAGGSVASVSTQWNGTDEQPGFARASSYLARFTGVYWSSTTPSANGGTNPYTQTRSNITTFGPFGVGSGGVLPVELLNFKAKKSGYMVVLSWSTASEINNSYFVAERSTDGSNFETIGNKIKGQGNSSSMNNYAQIDETATDFTKSNGNPIIYYRLVQIDYDGNSSFSKLISINMLDKVVGLNALVEPNPFTKDLIVEFNSDNKIPAQVQIMDMAGRILLNKTFESSIGNNNIRLDNLESLNNGVYFITISQGEDSQIYKIVKGE